ncbi:hypothetical protein BJ166DRAFT_589655 [Pestalotiopsis sp. NC0098]|nr:hypothetical protein BJ166DRAFT_589655 [Pestalotiopsis sp. NC0098]
MRLPPASVLASWPAPNYVDPVMRGPAGQIVSIMLAVAAPIVLAMRMYTRLRVVRSFGLDDVLILVAFIPSIALTACSVYAEYQLGWDVHIWDLSFDRYSTSSQMSLAAFILFDLGSNFVKLSILAMLYRLVHPTESRLTIIVLSASSFVVVTGILFGFIIIFQCSPVSDYWTLSVRPQKCIDEAAHLLVAGITNILTDFAIVILPIRMTASLQLPRRQHYILYALFCTGFCACVVGVVRTYYTWVFTTNYDKTWYGWAVWVSSTIELYVGIACASIPACRHFFTHRNSDLVDSAARSSGSGGSNNKPGRPPRDTTAGSVWRLRQDKCKNKAKKKKKKQRISTRLSVTVSTLIETSYHRMPSAELSASEGPSTTWLANESMVALNEMLAVPPPVELPPVRPVSADGSGSRTPPRVWAGRDEGEQDLETVRPKSASASLMFH